MCGYTAVPEDGRTCLFITLSCFATGCIYSGEIKIWKYLQYSFALRRLLFVPNRKWNSHSSWTRYHPSHIPRYLSMRKTAERRDRCCLGTLKNDELSLVWSWTEPCGRWRQSSIHLQRATHIHTPRERRSPICFNSRSLCRLERRNSRQRALGPVHTSNNVERNFVLSTKSKQIEHV